LPTGTAEDYFLIGKKAYVQADYVSAMEWLTAALAQLERTNSSVPEGNTDNAMLQAQVLDYLAFSAYRTNNYDAAITYSSALLALDRSNSGSRVADNLAYYRNVAASRAMPKPNLARNYTQDNLLRHDESEMADFRALCRGEQLYVPVTPLVCELVTYGNPSLLLQPARIERMHWGNEELSVSLRERERICVCECVSV
jgi:tetratricopeptide (TPR) repeat protein